MAYLNALASLAAGGGGKGLGTPPATLGTGTPPEMPGLPPAATGIGAMPTGDASTTRKAAADQAILALREAKGHFPQLGTMLDATVDQLKSAAQQQQNGAAAPSLGAPSPPGSAVPTPTPVMDSGSSGAM